MSELEKLEFLGKRQLSRENQEIAKDKEKVERGVKMEESMKGLPSIGMQHAERPIVRNAQGLVSNVGQRIGNATENYRKSGVKLPSMLAGNFDIGLTGFASTKKEINSIGNLAMPNINMGNMDFGLGESSNRSYSRHKGKKHKKTRHFIKKTRSSSGYGLLL